MNLSLNPDSNQLEVITAPISAQTIVTAGPGSGKTFTAAQRLIHIIEENGNDGNYLAVSFSNAAAQAIDVALTRAGLRGRVKIGTIDSWAGRLNKDFADPNYTREAADFDDGIELAIKTLDELKDWQVDQIDHLIIDEAQDIFGLRAALLSALCSKNWVIGWTMLGDLAQKIYDFGNNRDENGESLLEEMTSANALSETLRYTLLTDHRCSNPELENIRSLGQGLRGNGDPIELNAVWSEFNNFPVLTNLDQLIVAARVFSDEKDSTAILVRNNRLALTISEVFTTSGIQHKMPDGSEGGFVPDWVMGIQSCQSRSDVIEICPAFIDPEILAIEVAKICGAGRADRFDMRLFAQKVRDKRLPRVLLQQESAGITVSTIHQSKGLEYNRVVLEIEKPVDKHVDLEAETRVLFVGLTRASSEVFRFQIANLLNTKRVYSRSFDFSWKKNKNRPSGIELKSNDLQFLRPPPVSSELEIRLLGNYEDSVPRYALFEQGGSECLANVSRSFGRAVQSQWWSQSPKRFVGLVSIGLQTIERPRTFGGLKPESLLVHVPIYRSMLKVGE
jgi:DNA helicase-2/ATP-dependent DNA helicase PcrA